MLCYFCRNYNKSNSHMKDSPSNINNKNMTLCNSFENKLDILMSYKNITHILFHMVNIDLRNLLHIQSHIDSILYSSSYTNNIKDLYNLSKYNLILDLFLFPRNMMNIWDKLKNNMHNCCESIQCKVDFHWIHIPFCS